MALRVGIVDVAGWFYPPVYMEALKQIEQVDLVSAAFLASDEYMKKVNYTYGKDHYVKTFGVKPYEDIEEMIRKEKLNAVCLFGEYSRKADYIEIAARNGVDIFTTKPPAVTLEQMKRIVEAGRQNGVSITVPEHTRFNNTFREAHRKVREGEIGKLISARVLHQHGHLERESTDPDHWYLKEENGGPEISLAWYTSGLLQWFVESEPVRAFAEYGNYMTDWYPFMDNGKAMVRFQDGTVGTMAVYFSTEWPYPGTEVELIGNKGAIVLRIAENGWTEYTLYNKSGVSTCRRAEEDSIPGEMRSWVKARVDRTEPEMSAVEAMKVLELCIAWKESAKTNQPVHLPLTAGGNEK